MKPIISVKEIDQRIIYIRHRGSYEEFRKQALDNFKKLYSFGTRHQIILEGLSKVLTIYEDNPYITEGKNLRTSVAFTCSHEKPVDLEEDITERIIVGKYAVVHLEIFPKDYQSAWENVYKTWINSEGFELRDSAPFEMYLEKPSRNKKSKVDFYIPIK